MLESTKEALEEMDLKINGDDNPGTNETRDDEASSPTSKLLLKYEKRSSIFETRIQEEIGRYEAMPRMDRRR